MFRIGIGNDTHRLVAGRPLIIGGVLIESDRGADGHSDADALSHALADAILGALCAGDLGVQVGQVKLTGRQCGALSRAQLVTKPLALRWV